ncbi:F-actin-uncapping protein LRRC16A-like [Hemiscyllium ocellatum]|uniref:F-actin-uncapping protein LRRC16A-like n=1 Tax=Hemiscyllium ocellatum TaxID=170820 RepID=UPI0029665BE4|nr:F-actin-uncapping protein LRRC16A-like [Hemiscyllium ocellatum]
MSRSRSIEDLEMENTGLKMDFALKLTAALTDNPFTSLTALNLANNALEDKGVSSLSHFLAGHHRGLRYLNLSRTSLTHKGLVTLAQTLSSNQTFANSLTHLDLSRNAAMLGTDDASHLYNFLGKPNVLIDLNLSGTDCSIDTLFGALVHGCCSHLARLQLSNNVLSHRKAKEPLPSMKTFFACAFSLSYVNFSGTKMSPEALR